MQENRDLSSTTLPTELATVSSCERYEPPDVAWEEEFAPVAVSVCDPLDPECPPG